MMDMFLFADLAAPDLVNGKTFDALAPGKFVDMYGRKLEIKTGDLEQYAENTRRAIDATKTEGGEIVGLPIDAFNHEKGDGAGWIVAVEVNDGRLRVTPKWTEVGTDLIVKGIRRFFSATVDVGRKVIMGGTLTNWPASRDHITSNILLRPIELSDQSPTLYELVDFDDSPWDAAAVESGMEIGDFRKCCLLDLNGYPGQDGDPKKSLAKLAYKKSPDSAPNRAALRAMATGHGISAVKRPPEVPPSFYKSKMVSAAKRIASLWGQAFDTDVPENIQNVASGELSYLETEDNLMALELTQEGLNSMIDAAVSAAVGQAVTKAIGDALPKPPPVAPNGNGNSAIATAELISTLGLDKLEAGAQQRIEAAIQEQFVAVQKNAETQYMLKLAQVTRKHDVAEFATRMTGGTAETPRGLPAKADELSKHLLALPKEEAQWWMDLCKAVVEGGVVEFAELGNNKPTPGTKPLPEEVKAALDRKDFTIADLSDPILGLGNLSEYDLTAYK